MFYLVKTSLLVFKNRMKAIKKILKQLSVYNNWIFQKKITFRFFYKILKGKVYIEISSFSSL
ncbi:hypothetical protein Q763_03640 [Flavobacterium beibuense F44-8]|uniref:Uncharacterized protein n=1 Tax=Flavobacterium beibuense F44-8 TaxID=1406840 RepID=A0A0A2LWJ4_9FLAO|nr:hypothetical protein Q763_03640 [Flavobacterium beibuense F44-8]